MARRADRMEAIHEKARRTSGAPRGSNAVLTADPWEDETPTLSLARRLEQDPRWHGRVAHWLFIKGGMALVLLSGLMVLGLIGGLLGGR